MNELEEIIERAVADTLCPVVEETSARLLMETACRRAVRETLAKFQQRLGWIADGSMAGGVSHSAGSAASFRLTRVRMMELANEMEVEILALGAELEDK